MGTKKGTKKRFWSDEEKRSICLQTKAPDISVAQVARRYAMNEREPDPQLVARSPVRARRG